MTHEEKVVWEYCLHRLRNNLAVLFVPENPFRVRFEAEIDEIIRNMNEPDDPEDLTE